MIKDCLDIGQVQAFLDGEISPERSIVFADHIAECDDCTLLLAAAEEENSFVFAALDRDLDTLVPTQRLWGKINDTLELDNERRPFWQKLYAAITANLMSPSLTAAAGIMLFVVVAGGIWMMNPATGDVISKTDNSIATPAKTTESVVKQTTSVPPSNDTATVATSNVPDGVQPAFSPTRAVVVNAGHRGSAPRQARVNERPVVMTAQYFEGEESYVRTINTLSTSVDAQKDRVLPAASRMAFERDLAVVNDAIKRTRDYVKKNPRDQAAKQVLYSSYQDKIDLLNSVGQRDELMATLR